MYETIIDVLNSPDIEQKAERLCRHVLCLRAKETKHYPRTKIDCILYDYARRAKCQSTPKYNKTHKE